METILRRGAGCAAFSGIRKRFSTTDPAADAKILRKMRIRRVYITGSIYYRRVLII